MLNYTPVRLSALQWWAVTETAHKPTEVYLNPIDGLKTGGDVPV